MKVFCLPSFLHGVDCNDSTIQKIFSYTPPILVTYSFNYMCKIRNYLSLNRSKSVYNCIINEHERLILRHLIDEETFSNYLFLIGGLLIDLI